MAKDLIALSLQLSLPSLRPTMHRHLYEIGPSCRRCRLSRFTDLVRPKRRRYSVSCSESPQRLFDQKHPFVCTRRCRHPKRFCRSLPDKDPCRSVDEQNSGIKSIWDRVAVSSPNVSDDELSKQIKNLITAHIRALGGFGFGSISVQVKDGVVTLQGSAAPQLALPMTTAVENTPGC